MNKKVGMKPKRWWNVGLQKQNQKRESPRGIAVVDPDQNGPFPRSTTE